MRHPYPHFENPQDAQALPSVRGHMRVITHALKENREAHRFTLSNACKDLR